VALSSSEAEFYALAKAVNKISCIAQVQIFMGIVIRLPVKVKVHNMEAFYMSESSAFSAGTRQMDTQFKYVKNLQEQGLKSLNS